jgi:hypothetical protein
MVNGVNDSLVPILATHLCLNTTASVAWDASSKAVVTGR